MAAHRKPRGRKGMGSVRKRAGHYQATLKLEGKQYIRTFDEEADAWTWMKTIKVDSVRGVLGIPEAAPRIRFDDLCRLYKVHKLNRWRAGTIRFYDSHVKGALVPHFHAVADLMLDHPGFDIWSRTRDDLAPEA